MRFRILGPLELTGADGGPSRLEPRQVRLLAALLLSPNRTVTRRQLVDAVWDEAPPATATRQIQNCVSGLRRRIGTRLVADGPGYRLRVGEGELDLLAFEELLGRAQDLVDRRLVGEAVELLRQALALWRGPALAGVTGRVIETAAARLDERRLTAIEQRADLELAIGRPHELVGELAELVAAHPLREALVGRLMLALYRSGRRADALGVYQDLRTRLADDLGLDPAEPLRELHASILRDEAALSGPPDAAVVPRQLPAPVRHFVGRRAELKELSELLPESPGAVVISAIDGTAGIGKTALALHWAHRVAARFPDGQLYVNLRGYDPDGTPTPPGAAVRGFLDALGVPVERIPVDTDARAALYRSVIAGRRVLVVLDNACDVDQVRPLLPGSTSCLAVVTSRSRLTGLMAVEGAHPIALDLLTFGEAHELLARHLGPERLNSDPASADALIDGCARLPLALAVVAARAAVDRTTPLTMYVAELADAGRRLDALDVGDRATQVRAVFSWSYERLAAPVARQFRLLGLHPGPEVSVAAAASLAGDTVPHTRTLLGELTRAHLLTEPTPGRYACHDLLRAYATEQTQAIDTDPDRRDATERMLDHYVHTAYAADRLINPFRAAITLPPHRPGVRPEVHADAAAALDWFTTEHPVLVAVLARAVAAGRDTHTGQLAWSLASFLTRRGHWADQMTGQRAAIEAARRLADGGAQVRAHLGLAYALTEVGRFDEAETQIADAMELATAAGDTDMVAHAHLRRASLGDRSGRYPEALAHARQALALYRAAGNANGQAHALNQVGWYHALLGDHRQALDHCERALAMHAERGNRYGQAATWDSLGYAHHHLGDQARAIACYEHALRIFREIGERNYEATILTHLGDAHHASGDPRAARDAWQSALIILDGIDHTHADGIRARLARSATSP